MSSAMSARMLKCVCFQCVPPRVGYTVRNPSLPVIEVTAQKGVNDPNFRASFCVVVSLLNDKFEKYLSLY